MKFFAAIACLFMPLVTFGQIKIDTDTLSLDRKSFSDSASVRKLIDGVFDHKEENPGNALTLLTYAYNRAVALKNPKLQAGAINVTAAIYTDQGQYQKALATNYDALKLFEKIGDNYGTAMVLSNLSRVYSALNKNKDAMDYLKRAEEIAAKNKLEKVLAYVYSNYSLTYTQLGQLKPALNYSLKVDTLDKKLGLKLNQGRNANNTGAIYYFLGDFENAYKYFDHARRLATEANDSITVNQAITNIGEYYEIKKRNPLPSYMQALAYFEKTKNNALVNYVATDISNYYKSKGNFDLALQYYQKAVKAGEANSGLQAKKNLALIQTQYETEKKEQKIAILNKENTIQKLSISSRNKTIGIIAGLFVLSIIMGGLFYNRHQLKQKALMQEQMLKQQDALTKAVVDAEENERKRIASDLHDGVGQLFSAVKMNLGGLFDRITMEREEDRFLAENTLALVEESCKEVRTISHQMMPNMLLRTGIASDLKSFIEKIDADSLKVSLETSGFKNRLESNVETMLYRIIQESINNVIKHAKATHLKIILNRTTAGIEASIQDNGVGFDSSNLDAFNGIGLKNVQTRIAYLKGTISYTSASGQGTEVTIFVPVT
jgi:two-component system NarL family sensor kinase